jgi:hypothetical protein
MSEGAFSRVLAGTAISVGSLAVGASYTNCHSGPDGNAIGRASEVSTTTAVSVAAASDKYDGLLKCLRTEPVHVFATTPRFFFQAAGERMNETDQRASNLTPLATLRYAFLSSGGS